MRLRGWRKNEDGAAAVEFALVAIPFVGLILMATQTAVVFFMDQALQTATRTAARQLMTGAAQTGGMTAGGFQAAIHSAGPYFSQNALAVNVQSGTNFASLNTAQASPTFDGTGAPTNNSFFAGGPGDVVIVQVAYNWPIFGGPLAAPLVNSAGGNRLLTATVVFKNEPYPS